MFEAMTLTGRVHGGNQDHACSGQKPRCDLLRCLNVCWNDFDRSSSWQCVSRTRGQNAKVCQRWQVEFTSEVSAAHLREGTRVSFLKKSGIDLRCELDLPPSAQNQEICFCNSAIVPRETDKSRGRLTSRRKAALLFFYSEHCATAPGKKGSAIDPKLSSQTRDASLNNQTSYS